MKESHQTSAPHFFRVSLQYEHKEQIRADQFYTGKMCAKNIVRYNTDSKNDIEFQKQDVDLSFELNGSRVMISEKFRSKDFGDLYLECYSKFPDTLGWMHHSNADFLACFFPERVLWINKKKLVEFFKATLWPALPLSYFEKIFGELPGKSGMQKQKIELNSKPYEIMVVQAFNQSGKHKWHTIGIGVPFVMLEDFNIPGKMILR